MKFILFLIIFCYHLICLPVECTSIESNTEKAQTKTKSIQLNPSEDELKSGITQLDENSSQKTSNAQGGFPDSKTIFVDKENKLRDGKNLSGHDDNPENAIPLSNGLNKDRKKLSDHSYKKKFSTDVQIVVTRKASSVSKRKSAEVSEDELLKSAHDSLNSSEQSTLELNSFQFDDSATTPSTVIDDSPNSYNVALNTISEHLESPTKSSNLLPETTLIPEPIELDSSLLYNDTIYMEPVFYSEPEITTIDNEMHDSTTEENKIILSGIGKQMDKASTITNYNYTLHTRKCCNEFEFFNTKSISCEQADDSKKFAFNIKNIVNDTANIDLNLSTESLKCGEGIPPKTVSNVSTSTYILTNSGIIYEVFSQTNYNRSEYCLELVGNSYASSVLTLAYCEKPVEQPKLLVRKCCNEYEFFNTKSISCGQADDSKKFAFNIKNIMNYTTDIDLNLQTSSLKCSEGINPKTVSNVSTLTHILTNAGNIYEISPQTKYNRSEYCLELVGNSYASSVLTLAYCEKPVKQPMMLVRKCCKELEFFSTESVSCSSVSNNIKFQENMLSIMTSTRKYDLHEEALTCIDGLPPNILQLAKNDYFIDDLGRVVESFSKTAYDISEYCLENVGSTYDSAQFMLVHCHKPEPLLQTFHIRKCCGEYEFFETSNTSCTPVEDNVRFINEFSGLSVPTGSPYDYHLQSNHLVCADGKPPQTNYMVSNRTHHIIDGGSVIDLSSNDIYNHSEYCLELVGSSYSDAHFTFAYCKKPKKPLKIRKCCKEFEFFNTGSISCSEIKNNTKFLNNMNSIIELGENVEYNLDAAPLKCADGTPPQMNFYISNQTHNIVEEGKLLDIVSHVVYEHNEYCLEFVGSNYPQSQFTLVYCHKIVPDYYYYEYEDVPEEKAVAEFNEPNHITVRKCCQENEYYNTGAHKCIKHENGHNFNKFVLSLSFSSVATDVNIISSRLIGCPDGVTLPTIHTISNSTHRLRHNGDLFDLTTGDSYNYSFYCMEKIGQLEFELTMTIALCHKANYILPKCCPIDQYFDEDELNCLPIPTLSFPKKKLLDNYKLDNSSYAVEPLSYFLVCQNALPAKESADQFFLRGSNLCLQDSCYNKKEYCIEYVGDSSLSQLKPIAYFCRQRYFVKCCNLGEILDVVDGCTVNSQGKSLLLKQLTRTRSIVRYFNYKECKDENALLLEDSFTKYIQWWLGEDGSHLVVQSDNEVRHIGHYCIDDFKDANGKIRPSAYVCEEDVENMIPAQRPEQLNRVKGGLGKCCPKSTRENQISFFSSESGDCQVTSTNSSRSLIEYIKGANFTKEYFHDIPKCPNSNVGYFTYPLYFKGGDYATVNSDGKLKIISMDGKCIQEEKIVHDSDFCFEHIMREDGYLEASAVVCARAPIVEIYYEKFGLLTTLLGISCVCLLATLISLFSMRVRRGLVSTRKVNTLAGKILVSFVGSHLIGFIALALTQFENSLNNITSPGCYVLAGFIQFFNLATFCWNTSICLESLLLTIHVSISDLVRYCLHSIWAWGFPGMMTLLMILMDYYQDDLPCGTITPKIGVQFCFHSNTSAMLLYFFLPIFFTLLANVLFLVGAKMLRAARLKRLEKGKPKSAQSKSDGTKPAHSGMRTHQNQNTKAESLRVVLWTGGTWFLELAGFVVSRYILPPVKERWFDYLWYIPTSINALRGVGIFAIIAITPEVKAKISAHIITVRNKFAAKLSKVLPDDSENSVGQNANDSRRRNMSITTMLSSIYFSRTSSVTAHFKASKKGQEINELKPPEVRTRKLGLAKSVSQLGSFSSETAPAEESCGEERKNSASVLPKVQEEDTISNGDEKTEECEKETSFC